MPNTKHLLTWAPEVYFILFAIWWAVGRFLQAGDGEHWLEALNYPALLIAFILGLQLILRKRMVGLIVAAILGIASAFLILALLADVYKYEAFDARGARFILKGVILIAINIAMAVFMFRKYLYKKRLHQKGYPKHYKAA